jgi:hypothetical protein
LKKFSIFIFVVAFVQNKFTQLRYKLQFNGTFGREEKESWETLARFLEKKSSETFKSSVMKKIFVYPLESFVKGYLSFSIYFWTLLEVLKSFNLQELYESFEEIYKSSNSFMKALQKLSVALWKLSIYLWKFSRAWKFMRLFNF